MSLLWPRKRVHRVLLGAALSSAILTSLTAIPAVSTALPVLAAASATPADQPPTPGTAPSVPAARAQRSAPSLAAAPSGLRLAVNERGRISRSISAVASRDASGAALTVQKPAGATVRKAYMATATTGYTSSPLSVPLQIDGQDVALGEPIASGISSYNYFADVTALVRAKVDSAPAGAVPLTITEPESALTDGEIVVVVFDDPSVQVDRTVSVLFGALQPSGDRYAIQLARPISLADQTTELEMSLGISYSFQQNGTQQFSTVDVNGTRMTSAAGGEDDGFSSNGGLITVGGNGDSRGDPVDANAPPTAPRSDDELYDLRPFVRDGDTSIAVTTNNPSLDDNVFLATFTMNPPVTGITTAGGDKFVQVALGDSYQSGEGAGFDARPRSAFRNAYLPNTYNGESDPSGEWCHRSLQNYASLNRNLYKPGADVVLIDRTCSGALIAPSDKKKPIVGPDGGTLPSADSQAALAVAELAQMGLTPADVDLVTVGMGGNDANFATTVSNCITASIVTELGRRIGGDVLAWVSEQIGCDTVDPLLTLGASDTKLRALPGKEVDAQRKLLAAFGNATILQLDYPDSLPARNAPQYCGGLRRVDIDYARDRAKRIDRAIADAAAQVDNPRLSVVSTRKTFGDNALCPGDPRAALANGVPRANFDAEVSRLMLDTALAGKVKAAVAAAVDARNCFVSRFNQPFTRCDVERKLIVARDRLIDVSRYLAVSVPDRIRADLTSRPGATDDTFDDAFDRSQGLFHPNAAGYRVLACDALATYQNDRGRNCTTAPAVVADTANGLTVGHTPLQVIPRTAVNLVIHGFQALSKVRIRLFSEPVDLGLFTADANGDVIATVPLPDVNPGVHSLEADGSGAGDVQVTKQVLLTVAGRPTGEYSTYLCCFAPEPEQIAVDAPTERVVVTVGGIELGTYTPDEDGGVLVKIPSVDRLTDPSDLVIEGRSTLTGKVVRQTVRPIPSMPSLWASSGADGAISISGSGFSAAGLVHSEGGVQVRGARVALTAGTEYTTKLAVTGAQVTVTPAARRVPAGQGRPAATTIAAYRPGGSVATSGQPYRAVDKSLCRNGVWTPGVSEQLTGIVYVPCAVTLTGGGTIAATIAAEGAVRVASANLRLGPATAAAPSVVSGATGADSVLVVGSGVSLIGAVHAVAGSVRVAGSNVRLECGVVAATVAIEGAGISTPMTQRCLPA